MQGRGFFYAKKLGVVKMTNLFAENRHREEFKRINSINIDDSVLIDITNISQWTQLHEKDEFENSDFIDNLPWELSWFEWKLPKFYKKGGKVYNSKTTGIMGVLAFNSGEKNIYNLYSDIFQKRGVFYLGTMTIPLSNHKDELVVVNPLLALILIDYGFDKQGILDFVASEVANVRFSTTFCHCRNIDYYEISEPEKLRKANIKRGKIPQETYKVLDIGGLKKQAKSNSKNESEEVKTALHICRGHFKTFTEDNPLLGRHTGTYWWPMHKRGSEKNGKINKDYRI